MEEPQYNTETIREFLRHQNSTWKQRIIQWYHDEFQAIPTCRSEAETAICLLYEQAGYQPPARFVWFLSPFDLLSSLHFEVEETKYILHSEHLKAVISARISEAENTSILYTPLSLYPKAPAWYWKFRRESIFAWMKSPDNNDVQELNQLEGALGLRILEALGDSIQQTKNSIAPYLKNIDTFISFWMHFVVCPDWIDSVLFFESASEFFSMPELLQTVELIRRVLKTCDWIIATEEVCFVSEKHIIAHHDEAGKLHSDSGLALEYADGWGIYAHHGIRIPFQEYHELEHQKKLGIKGQEKLW